MSVGEVILAIVVAVLGSSGLTTVLNRWLDKKDRKNAYQKGIMFCLLVNLQNEARRIIDKGYISRLEYNQFKEIYECYKEMGGDGYADELNRQIDIIAQNTMQGGML